jgi:cytochrome c556
MKRIAVGAVLVLVASWSLVLAQGEKLTVKEIMGRVNKGPAALFPTVRKNLNADAPDWAELQKQSKEIADLVESLGKKDPPRGEKVTWSKFTKDYAVDAKALADAAQKKDKDATIAAHTKITKACTACHNAHRPQ